MSILSGPGKRRDNNRISNTRKVMVLGDAELGSRVAKRLAAESFETVFVSSEDFTETPDFQVISGAAIHGINGFVHDFEVTLNTNGILSRIQTDFIIVAGSERLFPKFPEYGITASHNVLSLSQAENILKSDPELSKSSQWTHVAFLYGLKTESEPVSFGRLLSCVEQLQTEPKILCHVFAGNLKVAGPDLEARFRKVRSNGALFYKFEEDIPIVETNNGHPRILFTEPQLGLEMELSPDYIVVDELRFPPLVPGELFAGIPSSTAYAPYLQPQSMRYNTVFTPKSGIFAVGPSRGVYDADGITADIDSLITALGNTAAEKNKLNFDVDPEKCTVCLTCLRLCPHGAITYDKYAEIDQASCKSCGICASECPNSAIRPSRGFDYSDAKPRISETTVFACENSAMQALETFSKDELDQINVIAVPCVGAVSTAQILRSLSQGMDRIIIAGCFNGNCASIYGSFLGKARIDQVQTECVFYCCGQLTVARNPENCVSGKDSDSQFSA